MTENLIVQIFHTMFRLKAALLNQSLLALKISRKRIPVQHHSSYQVRQVKLCSTTLLIKKHRDGGKTRSYEEFTRGCFNYIIYTTQTSAFFYMTESYPRDIVGIK